MILIAGGTGTLGREMVRLLSDRGLQVRVLTRDPARARASWGDEVEVAGGDVRDPSSLSQALVGVDTVVSAMSGYGPRSGATPRTVDWKGNANLIRAAAVAGARRYVLVSVHGAAPDHPMELMRMKFRAEEQLKSSPLAWTIIRPCLFMETWLTVIGEPFVKGGSALVFGRGDNPINLVSACDVAATVERAVIDPTMAGVEIEVGGPQNLTLNQVASAIASATGKDVKTRHIPRPVLRLMAMVARPVAASIARLAHDAVVMDTMDFSFDGGVASSRSTSLLEAIERAYR